MKDLLLYAAAFLLGSIPTGILTGMLLGKSSKKKAGGPFAPASLMKFTWDVLKGALAVTLAHAVSPDDEPDWVLAGFLAVMGDEFPAFSKFKGTRGLGTTVGVFAGLIFWLLTKP